MSLHSIIIQQEHKSHRDLLVTQDMATAPTQDKWDGETVILSWVSSGTHKTETPKQTRI